MFGKYNRFHFFTLLFALIVLFFIVQQSYAQSPDSGDVNGDNVTTTAEIVGNKDEPKVKELNTTLQDVFEYYYGKPETACR